MITQEILKTLLNYDPDTGIFTWLVSSGRSKAGAVAGSLNHGDGYWQIHINNKRYKNHRLAWLYVHGTFPSDQLDHINRVRTDNRLCNLRMSTQSENMQNISIRKDNTSGHAGVSWRKDAQKWHARISLNYKRIDLGYFTDLAEAIAARKAAEPKYHAFQNQ